MKFKVGDKVKVIKSGEMGYIIASDNKKYYVETDKNKNVWCCYESDIEFLSSKKTTKEELLKMPIGTKITTNFDEHNVFVKKSTDRFINDTAVIADYEIKEDLSIFDIGFGDKIIKVEVPTYETVYDSPEEVKEMTMDEICKALGYNVKIVKEEN